MPRPASAAAPRRVRPCPGSCSPRLPGRGGSELRARRVHHGPVDATRAQRRRGRDPGRPRRQLRALTLRSADDRVDLDAWLLPVPGADVGVVLVHGKDGSKSNTWGDGFVRLALDLQAAGYQVLMLDLRGHGASGDGRYAFGFMERFDVIAGVQHLVEEAGVAPGASGSAGRVDGRRQRDLRRGARPTRRAPCGPTRPTPTCGRSSCRSGPTPADCRCSCCRWCAGRTGCSTASTCRACGPSTRLRCSTACR
jgi:hypothetical protein